MSLRHVVQKAVGGASSRLKFARLLTAFPKRKALNREVEQTKYRIKRTRIAAAPSAAYPWPSYIQRLRTQRYMYRSRRSLVTSAEARYFASLFTVICLLNLPIGTCPRAQSRMRRARRRRSAILENISECREPSNAWLA